LIFKAERFIFFGGDDRGLQNKGVKAYLIAPMSPPKLPAVFSIRKTEAHEEEKLTSRAIFV
jgi:hypothetical protein